MPRDGSGIYAIPPGTQGTPNTTIESAKYNAFAADLETDLNAVRPIIAGGTGANSATAARAAFLAERSMQVVTNFDSAVWEAGSFSAAVGATNAPVAGHAFAGIAYGPDQNNLVIEARDLSDTNVPGLVYVREKLAGVWGAWAQDVDLTVVNTKVAKAGDTMTGDLTVSKAFPRLFLNRPSIASHVAVVGQNNGVPRWTLFLGGNDAESGGDTGSSFFLSPHSDAGAQKTEVLAANRATGLLTILGNPTAPLGIAPKQYVDAAVAAAPPIVPAGTAMLFPQNAAPTGWTKSTSVNDRALRVVSGAGGGAGGVQPFSTCLGRTSTDALTLSVGNMPYHTHTAAAGTGNFAYEAGGSGVGLANGTFQCGFCGISPNGGNVAFAMGMDMRCQYLDTLVCTKN